VHRLGVRADAHVPSDPRCSRASQPAPHAKRCPTIIVFMCMLNSSYNIKSIEINPSQDQQETRKWSPLHHFGWQTRWKEKTGPLTSSYFSSPQSVLLHLRHVKTHNKATHRLSGICSWIPPRHGCGWSSTGTTPLTPRQWRSLPPPSGGTARREKVALSPPACRCWDCYSSQCVPVSPPAVDGIQVRVSSLL